MGEAAKGFSSAAQILPLPRRLGRRVLLKLAARGGMGDIYLAATMGLEGAERPCIVKTVRRDHIQDGSFLARFLDEARVQAQLQHPGVAQVLEAATDADGEPYTVVEYVEGRSLCEVRQRAIQTGVMIAWADALAIAIEVAQALAHVHERSGSDGSPLGIVHRDLSPQNVMVGYAGEVKLIDFGTARGHNRRCHTVAGVVFAKPGYVAPEVARQQVGDGRIDLYALGVVLWELCAGRRFLNTDPQLHLDNAAAGKLVIPAVAERCGAPPELDEVIAKLTKNDPDERYPRASLAVSDLARLLASAPPAAAGQRGVRSRVAALMHSLWPNEPARARSEFARLLHDARDAVRDDPRSGAAAAGENQTRSELARSAAGSPTGAAAARQATPIDMFLLPGTPYRLVRAIGQGASGVVWEAEHVELGKRVALKVLAAEHAASQASLERFRREGRALAALSHPNLVEILDFGTSQDGRVFLAMEHLVGDTLDVRLGRTPMGPSDATRIAADVCSALAAAHDAGLVHRDVNPQNVMLTNDGRVKLLDFGVALVTAQDCRANAGSSKERSLRGFAIFGTPEYMAPEQVASEPVDARTDVYALGCVLYEMLVGAPPFEGSSVLVMGKQIRDTPQAPRARAPGRHITSALEAVVMRAMAKEPRHRFPSARAMRSALEDTLAIPARRRTRLRQVASGVLMAAAMIATAALSAQWTRTHGLPFDDIAIATANATPTTTATTTTTPTTTTTATATTTTTASPTLTLTPIATAIPNHSTDPLPPRPPQRSARPHPEHRLPVLSGLSAERTLREVARR